LFVFFFKKTKLSSIRAVPYHWVGRLQKAKAGLFLLVAVAEVCSWLELRTHFPIETMVYY
jgi:hypothetical protein